MTESGIVLTWTNNDDNQTCFIVERSTDRNTWTTLTTTGTNVTTYPDSELTEGVLYYYRVRATKGGIASANVTTAASPLLASPTFLQVISMNNSEVQLQWQDISTHNTSYSVQQLFGVEWLDIGVADADDTSVTITGIFEPGTSYNFRLWAHSQWNNSLPSNEAPWTTAAWPAAPTDLTATVVSDTEIHLSWTTSTNADQYVIKQEVDGSGIWVDVDTVDAPQTDYDVNGLSADGTNYRFAIAATNTNGSSGLFSVRDPIQTQNQPPRVVNASANPTTVTTTTATLTALGSDDGGESHLIYTWSLLNAPANGDAFFDSNNGTHAGKNSVATFSATGQYTFQVTVEDTDGLSVVSSAVNVTVNQGLDHIIIKQHDAATAFGGTYSFSAQAFDQFSNYIIPSPTFIWSTNSGGDSSISQSGLYTAPSSGNDALYTVTASSGGKSCTVNVAVRKAGLGQIITGYDSTIGTVVTNQFCNAIFSCDLGHVNTIVPGVGIYQTLVTSPPDINGNYHNNTYVDFPIPVNNLRFCTAPVGGNWTWSCEIRVYEAGNMSGNIDLVNVSGWNTVDLRAYHNITRVEMVNIDPCSSVSWCTFSFDWGVEAIQLVAGPSNNQVTAIDATSRNIYVQEDTSDHTGYVPYTPSFCVADYQCAMIRVERHDSNGQIDQTVFNGDYMAWYNNKSNPDWCKFDVTDDARDFTIQAWADANHNGLLDSGEEKREVDVHVFKLDLQIDSNNDGPITDADNAIEDNTSEPGKIIIANRLDRTGNGVPDFADGIDMYGNGGWNRSGNFTPLRATVSDNFDPDQFDISFIYSASSPSLVTRSVVSSTNELPEYQPGSNGYLRLWEIDGSESRRTGVDYIVANRSYPASHFFSRDNKLIALAVEGINESQPGQAGIQVVLHPKGKAQVNIGQDSVRATVAIVQVVYTDVSGLSSSATSVSRISPTTEADGIACDWQNDVNDGALLEMRVVGSQILSTMLAQNPNAFSIGFGYVPTGSQTFAQLPDNGYEGQYKLHSDAGFIANASSKLHNLGIENVGEQYGSSTHYVLAAQFYRPPYEFDMANPSDPSKWRKLNLAVEVSGLVTVTGSKPNAITLTRAPVVLVHGINCDPSPSQGPREYWGADAPTSFLTILNNWGFNYFLVDHSGVDDARKASEPNSTWGCGEITDMWVTLRDEIDNAITDYNQGYVTAPGDLSNNQRRDRPDDQGRDKHGDLFPTIGGKNQHIAIQKVDITAHSYGGLISRWYIEQASAPGNPQAGSLFDSRRDVRKLVELGSPNRGSPAANLVDEIMKNGLIGDAYANLPDCWLQLSNFLRRLDRPGYEAGNTWSVGQFRKWFPDYESYIPVLPTALDTNFDKPLHFYQDVCVNSAVLAMLNSPTTAFNPDVAYAAIVGTENSFYGASVWNLIQPMGNSNTSLFPGIKAVDGMAGAADGIVPTWSASLPLSNYQINVNHISMQKSLNTIFAATNLLNGITSMSLGSAQRAASFPEVPFFDQIAYVGSTITGGTGGGGSSTGGGLNPDAMVKISVTSAMATAPYYGANANNNKAAGIPVNGILNMTITGVIEWGNRNAMSLQVVSVDNKSENFDNHSPWGFDSILDRGPFTYTLSLPSGVTPTKNTDLVPFCVNVSLSHSTELLFCHYILGRNGRSRHDPRVAYTLKLTTGGTTVAPELSQFTFIYLF